MRETKQIKTEDHGLLDYWRVARRRYRLIGVVGLLVFIAGAAVTFLRTPQYHGEATVLVEDKKASPLDLLGGLSELGGATPIVTEMEVIKSRFIAEQVVADLSLDAAPVGAPAGTRIRLKDYESSRFPVEDAPSFVIAMSADRRYSVSSNGEKIGSGVFGERFSVDGLSWVLEVTTPLPVPAIEFKKLPFDEAVAAIQEKLSVAEVGKKTNIMRVGLNLSDPVLAALTVNKITDVYLAANVSRKSQEASQTLAFLEEQLETIRGNLEKNEQELDRMKTDKGVFVLSETAHKFIAQIGQLEVAKSGLELQQREFEHLNDRLQKNGVKDSAFILSQSSMPDPMLAAMIAELSAKSVEVRGLRHELTEDNPRVRLATAELDELKSRIKSAVSNAKGALDARVATAEKIISGYENQLKKLPQAERELAALSRKSEVNAELYTFLLKKHEESRIGRAAIVGNARVLDFSLVPKEPISPKYKRDLVVALAVGLTLGLLLAFFMEFYDDSIKTTAEVESNLGLSIYGTIPLVQVASPSEAVWLNNMEPRASIQEAFRSFRTNIQFVGDGGKIKTITCASAMPGAGKTTTVVNLATTLSHRGMNVLLVDCDLRRPQIHTFFNLACEPGITNALMTHASWKDLVHSVTEHLHVLPAGALPPNPAEFLASETFQKFLEQAQSAYDYVLIDVPPVVSFTDAAVIGARMDAVFLILELGQSSLPQAKRALELFANVNAKVLGAVLNRVKANSINGAPFQESYSYYYSRDDIQISAFEKAKAWLLKG